MTTYGGSRARDTLSILDPTGLRTLAVVRISSAATQLAADGHRIYVTTCDGDVVAVALPRSGPSPPPLQAVAPRPRLAPSPEAPASFAVVSERVIEAHSTRARTSGFMRSGPRSCRTRRTCSTRASPRYCSADPSARFAATSSR